jgi:molybdopterin/thiamine biosynthesis adenylyltransferase/rhodanese-related sulfurtransferase
MNEELSYRYQRQMLLPEMTQDAMQRILDAKVLVIGAGGLGCPCLQYLVAGGVGTIGIVDGDLIDTSNLHRQILFRENDINKNKADIAKNVLKNIHPQTRIESYSFFLNAEHALELFPQYDIIVDCTDTFSIRYLINDACFLLGKPLMYAAIFQFQGQLAWFNLGAKEERITLRDLMENIPMTSETSSCNEAGVLGASTGILGSMMAMEIIRMLMNGKTEIQNQLVTYDFRKHSSYALNIPKSKMNAGPQSLDSFLKTNYETQTCVSENHFELTQEEFLQKIQLGNVQVIDVRNEDEFPKMNELQAEIIPMQTLLAHPEKIDTQKDVLLFCHAGVRSLEALEFLHEECNMKNVYHLKGGIIKWNQKL